MTDKQGRKQLQHFTHEHPLVLVEEVEIEVSHPVKCLVCGEYCLGACYCCESCGIFLHQPCAEFQYPDKIPDSLAHSCSLALRTWVNYFICEACRKCIRGICYHCEPCGVFVDVECALLTSLESEDKKQIKHFSHPHPFRVEDLSEIDQVYCSACRKYCLGPTYVCRKCKISRHKSCAEFPPKINDLLHLSHPLYLHESVTQVGSRCYLCCNRCDGFSYGCKVCNFNLHVECVGKASAVKYEGHEHLLFLVENIGIEVNCNACGRSCGIGIPIEKKKSYGSWILRCPPCNFCLHIQCGPLPYTIRDKCHLDSLILVESPVEDESDDEFYCDACEIERDPRLPIYCCGPCGRFVAEISCVIPEVISWLKGEYGDVELSMPDGRMAAKVVTKNLLQEMLKIEDAQAIIYKPELKDDSPTLKNILESLSKMGQKDEAEASKKDSDQPGLLILHHILNSLSEDESKELRNVLATEETEISSDAQNSSRGSFFLDDKYIAFEKKLDSVPKDAMDFWSKDEEMVNVMEYSVPRSLVPILENLFAKHGDVSVDTTLSPGVKIFLFVILCGTISSMCDTRVMDIKEDLLGNWWYYLKALKSAGFKIQFAIDHMKRVVRAYFGLQLQEQVSNTRSQHIRDINKYSKEVEELTKKLEHLNSKLERLVSEDSGRKSSLIEECLSDASKLKWRKAGEGLKLKSALVLENP
ncbi:hypothetical protein I3843_09G032800 [Carya illinoinensis]|uniref:uncharacterized protein LOC122277458 n=1 Tax=Carya illinoinensis TaxID=32201 RepID=UPI001C71ADAD|nr:uncharacterized protein LOC122277458 [Carya illinoinensis]KAG7961760.1 hypothetical protein I3843_09G032800 [Carya illinoinensis]